MESPQQSAFNIGSDRMVSVNELVDVIETIADVKVTRKYIPGPLGVRGRNSHNDKVKALLNWEPTISLEEGMSRTFKWISSKFNEQILE